MTLCVATSNLEDSVPSGDLVPSVVGSPYIMYQHLEKFLTINGCGLHKYIDSIWIMGPVTFDLTHRTCASCIIYPVGSESHELAVDRAHEGSTEWQGEVFHKIRAPDGVALGQGTKGFIGTTYY